MATDPALQALVIFATIAVAELGDKSQLLCMALATRHKPGPVLLGAVLAFMTLNTLAVVLGTSLASWIPERAAAAVAALLFFGFGIYSLMDTPVEKTSDEPHQEGRAVWWMTFSLMLIAELGDKTQFAVAALAASFDPVRVWAAATAALAAVSAVGIWIGHRYLQRLPRQWLSRAAGCLFMLFAFAAGLRVFD